MRTRHTCALVLAAAIAATASSAPQSTAAAPAGNPVIVDRVLARIENDVITLSDVRELAAYQRLAGRDPEKEPELLRELIDQWVVAHDAAAARFADPPEKQVDAEYIALQNQVGTPEQFAARLRELDLSPEDVRKLVAKQIFLDTYLDRKFRAVARVEPGDVEQYYNGQFVPQLKSRNQQIPPLDDVRDSITDLLIERDITQRSQKWIDQARAQLDIEFPKERQP